VHSAQSLPRLSDQSGIDRWDECVSVIVPVYNEVAHLEELLQAVVVSPVKKEIIIVDDGSTDGTRYKLRALPQRNDLTIVFHERNCGKGASIRTALGRLVIWRSRFPELSKSKNRRSTDSLESLCMETGAMPPLANVSVDLVIGVTGRLERMCEIGYKEVGI